MRSILICAAILSLAFAQDAVFRVDTSVVEMYASVFDKRGNPVPNLSREQFQVTDSGQPQPLLAFEGADERLSVALLLDVTGSMDKFLPTLKLSVLHFVEMLREQDEMAVYSFNTSLHTKQSFTSNKSLIKQAVLRTAAAGSTALFDSLSKVSRDLQARKGKKVLVVFTDGDDNSSSISAQSASNQARRAGLPVYTIAQGAALASPRLLKVLEAMATDTGGIAFRLRKPDEIAGVFADISRNLKHTYLMSWKLPDNPGTAWRPITLSINGLQGARVRARQGYWPPRP